MLPSTGYFKGINCPFYDSGFCERSYCHFRHVKKDSLNNDEIESGSILQKLVSAAVQKVLRQTETGASPSLKTIEATEGNKPNNVPTLLPKPTYNPTPIAELNKINNNTDPDSDDGKEQKRKHIPVPYTPRKPASIPVKRPIDSNGCNLFTYIPPAKYTPGSTDNAQPDPYTPQGSKESSEKYLPGTDAELQQYTPNDIQTSNKVNYIPSDKGSSKSKILEYKPVKVVKSKVPSVTYKPTPRALAPCFSSDEEEPHVKKIKISSDLNGLDELGAEFDILDQILDEENSEEQTNSVQKKDDEKGCKSIAKAKGISIKENEKIDDKKERKSKKIDKKSSHKSSHRDKVNYEKDKEKDKGKVKDKSKESSEKKSRSSDRESRHSKSTSKESKHSKDSKRKHENSHHKSHKRSKEKKEEKHKKRKESSAITLSDNDDSHDADQSDIHNVEPYVSSDSDEEAIALECKRIFEEYVPVEKQVVNEEIEEYKPEKPDEYIPGKKRISRTVDKNIKMVQKPPAKPDYKANARQAMAERLMKVREYHASKSATKVSEINTTKLSVTKPISTPTSGSSKIRIAHVPYASTMMSAKRTISTISTNHPQPVEPSTSTTVVQTVKKGSQRIAHMPGEKFIDRPGVLEPLGSKIPANIRSTYLNIMIDNCLKIYLTAEDAYARAQHEELATSKKCSTIPIYKNSAVLSISRLKKELKECNGVKKSGSHCGSLQKMPQTVTGTAGTTGSWSIESKNRNTVESDQLYGAKLYKNISKWILTEEQLQENGFPRPHTSGEKGRAIIYKQNKQSLPKGYFRTCCRCKKDYTIDKKGFPVNKEDCIYHPNNKYRIRGEVRYQCCSQDGFSDGCCIASTHVYEYIDYENLKGYIKTLHPETTLDDYGVYSLDCEMCYTTQGLDLTRITVINSSCKVVYETLVRPLHPIIDYNTRYSGITEEQMSQVKTTLLEVQATLLTMFTSKTILIGHSLESDFKALKLIHDTIVDTSVLFPHKMGPPYKRALRNLSSEYLKKIIQNSVEGHDSAEDATVCMELILYKVKEDLKSR